MGQKTLLSLAASWHLVQRTCVMLMGTVPKKSPKEEGLIEKGHVVRLCC